MKYIFTILALFISYMLNAQVIFEENFESRATGFDLTTDGYLLSQATSYTGTVTFKVISESGNKSGRLEAKPTNSGAKMQVDKVIEVTPNARYKFELVSKGDFKRQLRVSTLDGNIIASTQDYKPSTEPEKITWYAMNVSFFVPTGVTQVKVGFHHYWSGTIDLDNIKVTKQDATKQTAYYLSTDGDDANDGTASSPWKTLAKISSTVLLPGDTVLFQRGDVFQGHYVVNGSGSEDYPILITAYGEGEKPVITGQVGAAGGGDYAEAIRIENCDNLILDGLEVQNERLVSRNGVKDTDAFGISINNSGNKVMRNFLFKNMKICNVYAAEPMLNKDDFDKIQVSGIRFTSAKNTVAGQEKNINGVEIKDCYFTDLQRLGVQFKHSGGATGIGNDSINRNMNIHIHNNEFYYLGGTGVLPNGTYNCLIENNLFDHPGATTDSRMPGRGSSIWNYKAINTIMQYNTVISTRGYLDSYGIHIDKHNKNTFVQYNYMVDCIGGFVEILADNINAVYRFNVSVNSGWRYTNGISTWKAGSSTIYIYSDRWTEPQQAGLMLSDGVYVYNNTVVMDSSFETTFNVDAKNMFIYNNIFSSTNGAKMGYLQTAVRDNDTPFNLRNNLYEGDVNPAWIEFDKNPIHGSSHFTGVGEGKLAFDLTKDSNALDKGIAITGPIVPGAGFGVFKNIPAYPTVDFYGNPIDLSAGTPNIGASNAKFESPDAVGDIKNNSKWLVYPDMQNARIRIKADGEIAQRIQLTLSNLNGQQVSSQQLNPSGRQWFTADLSEDIPNGIYVLQINADGTSHARKLLLHR